MAVKEAEKTQPNEGQPQRDGGREYAPNFTFFFPCVRWTPTGCVQPEATIKRLDAVRAGQPPGVGSRVNEGWREGLERQRRHLASSYSILFPSV